MATHQALSLSPGAKLRPFSVDANTTRHLHTLRWHTDPKLLTTFGYLTWAIITESESPLACHWTVCDHNRIEQLRFVSIVLIDSWAWVRAAIHLTTANAIAFIAMRLIVALGLFIATIKSIIITNNGPRLQTESLARYREWVSQQANCRAGLFLCPPLQYAAHIIHSARVTSSVWQITRCYLLSSICSTFGLLLIRKSELCTLLSESITRRLCQ